MSKASVIVPKVPSAKVLARYRNQMDGVSNAQTPSFAEYSAAYAQEHLSAINVNPEAKAMLLESARIHDENEDRSDKLAQSALDELSPHARAALNRLLGKAHDPE